MILPTTAVGVDQVQENKAFIIKQKTSSSFIGQSVRVEVRSVCTWLVVTTSPLLAARIHMFHGYPITLTPGAPD